jgi:hypothetical protein
LEPPETGHEPVELVPELPLSMIILVVDPVVPEEELVPLVVPVELVPLVVPVELVPLVELVGTV